MCKRKSRRGAESIPIDRVEMYPLFLPFSVNSVGIHASPISTLYRKPSLSIPDFHSCSTYGRLIKNRDMGPEIEQFNTLLTSESSRVR